MECTSIFGFGSYPPKFPFEIPSKFHQRFPQFLCHVPQNSPHSSPSVIRYQNHLTSIKMSEDSDSDFGFDSSSQFSDDDEPSTTTPEAVIDDESAREQQQRRQQEDVDKNKDNKKLKENKDVPSLDG